MLLRVFSYIFSTVGILVLLYKGFPVWKDPTLFMDEGYFIGAALRFLDGNVLLSGYTFDYPLILVVTQALGILIGGKTHIGFRLINVVLFLGCYLQFVRILRREGRRESFWFESLIQAFALGLFSQEFMVYIGFSAFSESIVLFFSMSLFLEWQRARSGQIRWQAISYLLPLSLFTKYSAVFWCIGGIGVLKASGLGWKTLIQNVLRRTWWLWLLCFVFVLKTGGFRSFQTAFSPFQQTPAVNISWTQRVAEFWTHSLGGTWAFAGVMAMLALGSIVYYARQWRVWRGVSTLSLKQYHDLFLILVPVMVQTLILATIQTNRFHERYLFLYLPQIVILIVFLLREIDVLSEAKSVIAKSLALIFAVAYLLSGLRSNPWAQVTQWRLPSDWGRAFYSLATVIPEGTTVFYPPSYNWEMRPWMALSQKNYVGCEGSECLKVFRVGLPVESRQYILRHGAVGEAVLEHAPLVFLPPSVPQKYYGCIGSRKSERLAPRTSVALADLFLERLRQRGAFEVTEFAAGQMRLRAKKRVFGSQPEFLITGKFVAAVSSFEGSHQPQWFSFFDFKTFDVQPFGISILDLMPVFFKSYSIRLEPLEWMYSPNELVNIIDISDKLDAYRIQIETADIKTGC